VRAQDKDNPNIIFGWTLGGSPGVINAPNDDYTIIDKPAADIAKDLTKHWHARVKPPFDNMQDSEAAFWKITCSDPNGVPDWPNELRVTLIGDAVHAMTPAGGNGANTAVKDSALLGKLLAQSGGYREGLTNEYEDEMRAYGSEAVKQSYAHAKVQFGTEINESTPVVNAETTRAGTSN
jgi:2-polyprenyl-6-methoxyphenol hydroxylase-like FAD-dependent oxidoreductase